MQRNLLKINFKPDTLCENCAEDGLDTLDLHRCRANEDSCVHGKNCPDHVERCTCPCIAERVPLYNYIAEMGLHCPNCRSSKLNDTEPLDLELGVAYQHISCNDCGASWEDIYTLNGISNLKVNGNEITPI